MKEFTYSYPTRVYFGEGSAAKALPAELPKVGKTVILAYGGGSGFSDTQETIAKLEPGCSHAEGQASLPEAASKIPSRRLSTGSKASVC